MPILLYKSGVFVLSIVPVSWYYFIRTSKHSITPQGAENNPRRGLIRFPRSVPHGQPGPGDSSRIKHFFVGGIFMLRIQYLDKDRFMQQVAASRGSVLLHLANGETCDLKKDSAATELFQMMDAPSKGFDISVTDPA
ncbi:hypothetical protein FAEPRAA2165_01312, partial [Faecalibacterium duncaniae]